MLICPVANINLADCSNVPFWATLNATPEVAPSDSADTELLNVFVCPLFWFFFPIFLLLAVRYLDKSISPERVCPSVKSIATLRFFISVSVKGSWATSLSIISIKSLLWFLVIFSIIPGNSSADLFAVCLSSAIKLLPLGMNDPNACTISTFHRPKVLLFSSIVISLNILDVCKVCRKSLSACVEAVPNTLRYVLVLLPILASIERASLATGFNICKVLIVSIFCSILPLYFNTPKSFIAWYALMYLSYCWFTSHIGWTVAKCTLDTSSLLNPSSNNATGGTSLISILNKFSNCVGVRSRIGNMPGLTSKVISSLMVSNVLVALSPNFSPLGILVCISSLVSSVR